MSLCDLCYQCFEANEKCDYCFQVYFSTADDGEVDGRMWISCDRCQKWNHPDCEIDLGEDEQYREAARELKRLTLEEEAAFLAAEAKAKQDIEMTKNGDENADQLKKLNSTESPAKPAESPQEDPLYYCLACRLTLKQ